MEGKLCVVDWAKSASAAIGLEGGGEDLLLGGFGGGGTGGRIYRRNAVQTHAEMRHSWAQGTVKSSRHTRPSSIEFWVGVRWNDQSDIQHWT